MSTRIASPPSDVANGVHYHAQLPARSLRPSRIASEAPSGPPSRLGSDASIPGFTDAARSDVPRANGSSTRLVLQVPPGLPTTTALPITKPDQPTSHSAEDGGYHMRHGWDSQYTVEQLRELTTVNTRALRMESRAVGD